MSQQVDQSSSAPASAPRAANDFARAAEGARPGIVREFIDFLKFNKKWWLVPLLIVLLGVGVLVLVTSTAAGPFLYTLF